MSQNHPVIFFVGPPKHGKTTARKACCVLTGLRGESTSEVIYHWLAKHKNVSVEALKQLPKESVRPELIKAGDYLTGEIGMFEEVIPGQTIESDYRIPSALVRMLVFNGFNIIDGLRRPLELQDAIHHLEWNGVRTLTIWVQDPRKEIIVDNTKIVAGMADEVISNDGTEAELKQKIADILNKHFPVSQVPAPPPPVLSAAEAQALGLTAAPAAAATT